MADLEITDVKRNFGSVVALDGMSLHVEDGEFFCILGPSSSGKTTTLRAISGLEELAGGTIRFGGEDVTRDPVQGRGIGMIFQTFALYPHLSIRRNLAYPLEREGLSSTEISRRVDEIAALLRVRHTLDRKPPTLSGGEQQRVAIGRAIIRRPKLLLLDEPLTNLDAKLRHDMRAEFKRLHRELGMTMLLATPDQLEALTMGERVAVIREGKVVETGTPRDLYGNPHSPYVASMVGAPAINLIDGTVREKAGGRKIELPFGEVDAPSADLSHGDAVTFGIRPHDIHLGEGAGDRLTLKANIHLTEPLGDVTIFDVSVKNSALKMVLREEVAVNYATGQDIDISLGVADAHIFMKETGTRIA